MGAELVHLQLQGHGRRIPGRARLDLPCTVPSRVVLLAACPACWLYASHRGTGTRVGRPLSNTTLIPWQLTAWESGGSHSLAARAVLTLIEPWPAESNQRHPRGRYRSRTSFRPPPSTAMCLLDPRTGMRKPSYKLPEPQRQMMYFALHTSAG